MKRRLLTIAIFLLLGAVVNVAVAWGCTAWVQVGCFGRWSFRYTRLAGGEGWISHQWDRAGVTRVYSFKGTRLSYGYYSGSRWDEDDMLPSWCQSLGTERRLEAELYDARGWPLPSLACRFFLNHPESQWRISLRLSGIELAPDAPVYVGGTHRFPRALPLRPIWPGFAINTLFYAAILWLLIPGPFALRRLIRRWRGLCPKCGYPMGESSVCTECGHALPQPARAAT